MCCCCLPRCSIICAGVWCLIQSIAWATVALIAIFVYTCDILVEYDPSYPEYFLYFIYFFNRDCAVIPDQLDFNEILVNILRPPDVTTADGNSTDYWTTPFPIPDWPERFVQADYTHTLMTLYAGFNAAWAVTCCIVIVAAAMSVRNWFAYVPWILLTAANIVLDVIATINFATDAVNSQTPLGLLENVIGLDLSNIPLENRDEFDQEVFSSLRDLTKIPSVLMALLTGRLGILWLLNVLFLICVPASIPRLTNKKGRTEHLTTYPHTEPRNRGFHNNSYTGESHSNEPGPKHDYSDEHVYSRGDRQRPSAIPDEVDRPQDHNSNARRRSSLPPEELRNQLPWSYFGPRNEPMKPKPKQESVAEEELEKPPVPVPDYTLHFGKTARPVASKWSDDGTSFTDSVASHRRTSASGVDRRSSLLQNNRH